MGSDSADVVVIGGGITGLAAAYEIVSSRPGASVVLLEASDRLGGKIATIDLDGIVMETGADSFLARNPAGVSLCEELGLGDHLVSPAVFGAVVGDENGLRPLPSGFVYGLPSSIRASLDAQVLSLRGRLRACADVFLPRKVTDDESIGSFVHRRFGPELLEKVVDPLLAGTRAGSVDEMSLAAAMPQIFSIARSSRSVIRGLGRATRDGSAGGTPPFVTVRGGLNRIVEALRAALSSVDVRTSTEARSISRNARYSIATDDGSIETDGVVVTAPAYASARLLAGLSPAAAAAMESVEHASVASVALVYDGLAFSPPPATSGLLMGSGASSTIAGCTWYSTKWPDSVPHGRSVLRCFVGRAGSHPILDKDDDNIVAAVVDDLDRLLQVRSKPQLTHVTRWDRGLPQYAVGHVERIDYAERALRRDAPGVAVAGGGLRGSGIPDCIDQGRRAAASITAATKLASI